jgi:hypothetical protein
VSGDTAWRLANPGDRHLSFTKEVKKSYLEPSPACSFLHLETETPSRTRTNYTRPDAEKGFDMRKLLMASILCLAAVLGSQKPSNAIIPYPDCGNNPKEKITYNDCSTGAWCGATDIYCDGTAVHTGCTTNCRTLGISVCTCTFNPY